MKSVPLMLMSTLPALGVVFLGADGRNRAKQVLGEVRRCCFLSQSLS